MDNKTVYCLGIKLPITANIYWAITTIIISVFPYNLSLD